MNLWNTSLKVCRILFDDWKCKMQFQNLGLNQGPLTHEANALPTELFWRLKGSQYTSNSVFCWENDKNVKDIASGSWSVKVLPDTGLMQYLIVLLRYTKYRIKDFTRESLRMYIISNPAVFSESRDNSVERAIDWNSIRPWFDSKFWQKHFSSAINLIGFSYSIGVQPLMIWWGVEEIFEMNFFPGTGEPLLWKFPG